MSNFKKEVTNKNLMDGENIQLTRANILIRCVQHIAYYKVLMRDDEIIKKLDSPFWTATIDAHILQAIINWNMIFGSDGSNHYHWKQNLSDEQIKNFKNKLEFSLTKKGWDLIWKDMTAFRDKYAVHKDKDFYGAVPNLSQALKVVYLYDKWVFDNDMTDLYIPNLKNLYIELCQRIEPMSLLLLNITEQKYGSKPIEYSLEK